MSNLDVTIFSLGLFAPTNRETEIEGDKSRDRGRCERKEKRAAAESAGSAVDTMEALHFSDYRSAHLIFNDPIRNRFSS